MDKMNILALDLGTQTGWALLRDNTLFSGTLSFQPSRWEGGGMRFLRFTEWLNHLVIGGPIERVAFEEVRSHTGTDAAHVYGGFLGVLTQWCETHNIPYEAVPVGTIKKHATGKGNADKPKMLAAARTAWPGQNVEDDNQADALWLLDHVRFGNSTG